MPSYEVVAKKRRSDVDRNPSVTFAKNGYLLFNAALSKKLGEVGVTRALILWDKDLHVLALQQAEPEDHRAYFLSKIGNGLVISIASCLKNIGLSFDGLKGKRFPVDFKADEDIFLKIQLP